MADTVYLGLTYNRYSFSDCPVPANSVGLIEREGLNVSLVASVFINTSDKSFVFDIEDYPVAGETLSVSFDGNNLSVSSSSTIPNIFFENSFSYFLADKFDLAEQYMIEHYSNTTGGE